MIIKKSLIQIYGTQIHYQITTCNCKANCTYCFIDKEAPIIEFNIKELEDELKKLPKGCILISGYEHEALYQPKDLMRRILEVIEGYNFPVMILTKSNLILRDLDVLEKMNKSASVVVIFSFSTLDSELATILEPNVTPPMERLSALEKISSREIVVGVCFMPRLPQVNDSAEEIEKLVECSKKSGGDFFISGTLILNENNNGQMKSLYKQHFPQYLSELEEYENNTSIYEEYKKEKTLLLHTLLKKYNLTQFIESKGEKKSVKFL